MAILAEASVSQSAVEAECLIASLQAMSCRMGCLNCSGNELIGRLETIYERKNSDHGKNSKARAINNVKIRWEKRGARNYCKYLYDERAFLDGQERKTLKANRLFCNGGIERRIEPASCKHYTTQFARLQ